MASPYGRFTVRGSDAVESLMTALVAEAAQAADASLSPSEYRSLVMMGGYGRGEGGVEVVEGKERPHNNLDFLLIAETARSGKLAELRQRLLNAFDPVMRKYDIEIDLSVVSIWKLRLSPSLIIWYDTRYGHKTILGDAGYVPSLTQFRADRIPPRDALRLLVNRGTLLTINEYLIEDLGESAAHERRIIRNVMKAIIGYGDALLFFAGEYHWSYVERKDRMTQCNEAPPDFRTLYDEAAEFRLKPDYGKFASRDLCRWMAEVRATVTPLHRFCEETRLGVAKLDWEDYPALALAHALTDEPLSARAWARKAVSAIRPASPPKGLSTRARLGYRALGSRGRYPLAFPVVAYRFESPRLIEFAAAVLGVSNPNLKTLREAYVRAWCEEVDINALSTLRKWRMPGVQETNA